MKKKRGSLLYMQKKYIILFLIILVTFNLANSQQPQYTVKHFVSALDTSEFKNAASPKNGFGRYYILTEPEIWDTDDNHTTHFRGGGKSALICIEGNYKNGKKNGIFSFFLIDSLNHSIKYKIWEQAYVNDKLNGEWKTYNLKGTMVKVQNYKNDSLHGLSREYWIDGKRIMEEREFENGSGKYIARSSYKSGKLQTEQSFKNGVVDGFAKEYYENGVLKEQLTIINGEASGPAKRFYENGILKEEVTLQNGKLHKIRKYYYPNGKLWIEQEYNQGLPWTVIANYDDKGNKKNAGTLKNGNGTLLLYNEDGTVRETLNYINGKQQ